MQKCQCLLELGLKYKREINIQIYCNNKCIVFPKTP